MGTRALTSQNLVDPESCPQKGVISEAKKDEPDLLQKIHSSLSTKESKDNSAVPLVLEGIDTSLTLPQRIVSDGSLTFLWEGNKDVVLHSDSCKSEGSIHFSQAHSVVEVLQELFGPTGAQVQIILESQNINEVPSERSFNLIVDNLPATVTPGGDINETTLVSDIKELDGANGKTLRNGKQGNILESPKKSDSLSTFQLIHKCCYCRFRSETVAVVLDHVRKKHPGKPAKTKAISGRDCPYCGLRLDQTAFFQHMRQFHEDSHPFRCGYCNFMARDLNQLKHHCTKKHREESFKAFRRLDAVPQNIFSAQNKEKNSSCKAGSVDEDVMASKTICETMETCSEEKCENVELIESLGNTFETCPICQKKFKTLKYLKVHLRVHSKGRFKCGYCSYISAYCLKVLIHCKKHHRHLQPRVKQHDLDPVQDKNIAKNYDLIMEEVKKKSSKQPPDPDTRKWARKYSCPTCEYTCSYGASYRRHLTTHSKSPLPYRCHYCQFAGREKYYVRRHIQRVHRGLPAVVVSSGENLAEMVSGDTKKNLPPFSAPSRNLKSKKPKTKASKGSSNCAEILENYTEVISPVVEPSTSVHIEEPSEKRKHGAHIRNTDVTLPSCAISDPVEVTGLHENKLVPSECSNVNVSAVENDWENGSTSAKVSGGNINRRVVVLHPPKAKNKRLKNNSNLNRTKKSKEVRRILPVQAPVTGFSTDLKASEHVAYHAEGANEVAMMSDDLMSGRAEGSVNLVNLLGVVNSSNCENPAVQSVIGREDDNVSCQSSSNVNDSKTKDKVIKVVRKKGSKEKSSHKALDFVAYRDGKYTFCVCGTRTVNKAFYKHIKKHIDFKRFGCGHCPYRSIERSKIKVHHTFVHPGLSLNVNEFEENVDDGMDRNHLIQTLSYFSKEPKSSQLSTVAKESSSAKLSSPVFQCPICKKKISYHTYTIRRHLFSHCNYRPYKCGRCDFRGCSPGEVKQHSVFHGADLCPIVEPSGQQPPEGLEKLVTDCFNELQMKLGKKIRRRPKSNVKLIDSIREHVEKKLVNPNGYHLVTSEAKIWNQSLSNGVCPWCQIKLPSSSSSSNEPSRKDSDNGDIRSHFADHFYKPVGNLASSECRNEEVEFSLPTYPTGSLKDKDTIIMNGLMYYFINQPVVKETNFQKSSNVDQADTFKGEVGIIKNPDGMPPGTIQVTDIILADLRNLLWGHVNDPKPRMAHWHSCQLCKQQFRSSSALHHHSKSHASSESVGIMEEDKHCDFHKQSTTPAVSQVSEGEVGMFLLGDDVEVATAVVVINSEAAERENVLDVSS